MNSVLLRRLMANQGKHKTSPAREWQDGDESTVPTQSRSSHVVDSYIKKSKPTIRKFRTTVAAVAPVAPDSLRLREPGPAPKAAAKHSPATSLEHQRRVERMPQLRAPHQYRNR
jgi:hypothetical protein